VIRNAFAALFVLGTIVACCVVNEGCNSSSSGSGSNNTGPPPPPAVTWGVLSYSIGRNESDDVALAAITQLDAANLPNVGINYEAAFSGINTSNAPFATTRENTVIKGVVNTFVDLGQQTMIDPTQLESYIVNGVRLSGASHYALFIQAHGGGPVQTLGADIAPNTSGATIDLATLDTALAGARTTLGLAAFDIIALDVPESATVEAMAVLSKHASFMVAFEGAVPTCGFGYSSIVAAINATPSITAASLANTIAASVAPIISAKAPAQGSDFVCSAIDLSQTANLTSAINTLATSLSADLAAATNGTTVAAIGSARLGATEFEISLGTQVVDAWDFSAHLALAGVATAGALSNASLNAAASVANIASGAVKQITVGQNYVNPPFAPAGIGLYFPANSKVLAANYATAAPAFAGAGAAWPTFLANYQTKLAAGAVTPAVLITAPAIVTRGQLWTVTGSVSPLAATTEVTLYVTTTVGTAQEVVFSAPLGPPDVNGNIAYTNTATFATLGDGSTQAPTFVPQGRTVRGNQPTFEVDADLQYTNGTASNFRGGILKAQAVAGVGSGGFAFVSFEPLSLTGNIGHNDTLDSTGITYKVFPRVIVLAANGTTTSNTQGTQGYAPTSTGALSLLLDTTALPNPGSLTVWLVAQSFNGDLGVASQVVTFQ
jgi:hypothetical protein